MVGIQDNNHIRFSGVLVSGDMKRLQTTTNFLFLVWAQEDA